MNPPPRGRHSVRQIWSNTATPSTTATCGPNFRGSAHWSTRSRPSTGNATPSCSTCSASTASCEPTSSHISPGKEQELFPRIRQLAAVSGGVSTRDLAAQIETLADEHETVGALLDELRRVTSGYSVPQDGCASYAVCYRAVADLETDTHLHVHKENNLLFPAVRSATTS